MTGKTFEELFKALNDFNDSKQSIGGFMNDCELSIYIDDKKFYEGTSYVHFYEKLKEEYIKEFVDKILNLIWCGTDKRIVEYRSEHYIEVYVV